MRKIRRVVVLRSILVGVVMPWNGWRTSIRSAKDERAVVRLLVVNRWMRCSFYSKNWPSTLKRFFVAFKSRLLAHYDLMFSQAPGTIRRQRRGGIASFSFNRFL